MQPSIKQPKWSLEKRDGLYFIRFRWNKTKPRIALGIGNQKEAEAEAQAWMDNWFEGEVAKAAEAQARALERAQEATKHPAEEWLGRYMKKEFQDKYLADKTMSENHRYLQTLIRLSKIQYLEELTRDKVDDALVMALKEIQPKRKFSRKDTVSSWTTLSLVRSWKKWLRWLAEDGLVDNKTWNKLKAPTPKAEEKQAELWFWREYQGITALATSLDRELYACLRFMGIDPADLKEMERGNFERDGRRWRFIKERAKKAEHKTGTYNQIVDERAMSVLLPRIKIDEIEDRKIFPELDIYKNTDSFTGSFGDRNAEYWDRMIFKCERSELTEIRKGKDYRAKLKYLPSKRIQRKVKNAEGITLISDRTWRGGAKYLPDSPAYLKRRRIKLVHSLRYTYATAQSELGKLDIRALRPALGHAKDSRVLERFYDHPRSPEEIVENPLE